MASTAIRSLDYDRDTATLTVEFPGRARYRYQGVSLDTLAEMTEAPSLGEFFNYNIRERYPTEKVR